MDYMGNETNIIAIQDLVMTGNLAKLQPEQKMEYYNKLCDDLGLNPLTKPFQLLTFNGKEILYATKDCTDQLRKLNGVSITSLESKEINGVYVVTAKAQDKHGRIDTATGALPIATLKGDALANALMKCETKAKRRVTLSISGLGFLDESEVETMSGVVVKEVPPEQPKLENKHIDAPPQDIDPVLTKPKCPDDKFSEIMDKIDLCQNITELQNVHIELLEYALSPVQTATYTTAKNAAKMKFAKEV
jgi:hypothetical protein